MPSCPACGSSNITPYKVGRWKCLDCGAIFTTPIPDVVAPPAPAAESAVEAAAPVPTEAPS